MNQKTKILNLLNYGTWTCSTIFQQAYLPEFRSLINKLRIDGHNIETRRCRQHKHKMNEWKLSMGFYKPLGTTKAVPGVCCSSWAIFQTHERNCESLKVKEVKGLF